MTSPFSMQSVESLLRKLYASVLVFVQKIPADKFRKALLLALILWIVVGLVQLVWAMVPSSEDDIPVGKPVIGQFQSQSAPLSRQASLQQTKDGDITIDLSLVKKWELFGEGQPAVVKPVEVVSNSLSNAESRAKETRLQLALNGIIESSEEKHSRAVITYQGKQDQYKIGDKLPVSGRVTVQRLLVDRVLLNNSGKIEALFLYDKKRMAQSAANHAAQSRIAASNTKPTIQHSSMGRGLRQKIMQNPSSITDIVRISEARKDGKLIGYKVRPSRDKDQFEQLGLQSNDIVLSVNGIALDNVTNAMKVFQTLRSEKDASFELSRNGENINLQVSLDDIEPK